MIKFFENIITVSLVCGAIVTIATFIYKIFKIFYYVYKKKNCVDVEFSKINKQIENLKVDLLRSMDDIYQIQSDALKTLLRNTIMEKTDCILDRGKITKEESFALGKLYECYKKLNGNSTVDLRVRNALSLRPDRGPYDFYFEKGDKKSEN